MRQANYMCGRCFKIHPFPESDTRRIYFCPDCGQKMSYVGSEDIDEKTGLVVERYRDEARQAANGRPIVKCPYCHSTYTQKLPEKTLYSSYRPFIGRNLSEVGKNFHCNKCGADF